MCLCGWWPFGLGGESLLPKRLPCVRVRLDNSFFGFSNMVYDCDVGFINGIAPAHIQFICTVIAVPCNLGHMIACRAGTEDEWEEEARLAEEHREPSQAVWAAYWGFDSCGPGGILDRLYTALRIPQKSWGGLKRLPEVGGISYERRHSYMHLVSNFLQVCVTSKH